MVTARREQENIVCALAFWVEGRPLLMLSLYIQYVFLVICNSTYIH
jgi:hypothetical protein